MKVAVAMGGAPTPVINASLQGIMCAALLKRDEVFISRYGVTGLIEGDLERCFSSQINFDMPGAAIGTSRHKIKGGDIKKIIRTIQRYRIDILLMIGGNDTMDSCRCISDHLEDYQMNCSVVGIPKTIDNDLLGVTYSPGFRSAAHFVAETVANLIVDHGSFAEKSITIIETMGRNAGWLTGAACFSGLFISGIWPDFVLFPEKTYDITDMAQQIKRRADLCEYCSVVISEGTRDMDGNEIGAGKTLDSFGHPQLRGAANILGTAISKIDPDVKIRIETLGTFQRICDADKRDWRYARRLGFYAELAARKGVTNVMAQDSLDPRDWPRLGDVANLVSSIPLEWLNDPEKKAFNAYYEKNIF